MWPANFQALRETREEEEQEEEEKTDEIAKQIECRQNANDNGIDYIVIA